MSKAATPTRVPPESAISPRAAAAFATLDAANVRWALLRDDPDAAGPSDIDLLVAPTDAERLDPLLAAAGFARLVTWRHGIHRFFVGYDPAAGAWLKLDVVTGYAYRSGHRLPDPVTTATLHRAIRAEPITRLHPDDEFWALLLHCLLDRGAVPPRHLTRLQRLCADRQPGGPIRAALPDPEAAAAAIAGVRAGDVQAVLATAPRLRSGLPRLTVARRLRDRLLGRLTPLFKALRRPGLSVALMGPDGAGKSTLIRALADGFAFPTRTFYVGLYGRRSGLSKSPNVLKQLVRAWRAYLAGAYHRSRGRLVVYDRYGYDALLPSPTGRSSWKRRLRAMLLGRLSPHPDLVVILDAPPEVLLARKQEHDHAALERQRAGFLLLAKRLSTRMRVEVVDAGRDPASVARDVIARAWQTFTERTGG